MNIQEIHNIIKKESLDGLKQALEQPDVLINSNDILRLMIKHSWWEQGIHYMLTRNDVNINANIYNGEMILIYVLKESLNYARKPLFRLILRDPKLDFENNLTEAHRLLKVLIQIHEDDGEYLLDQLLSDPRFHRAFEKFTDKHIQELWCALEQSVDSNTSEMLVFRILMYGRKKYPHLTYGLSKLSYLKSYQIFDSVKKALLHPEQLIFCFGFSLLMRLSEQDFPVLKGKSEDERLIRYAKRITIPLHRAAAYCYSEEHRRLFKLLLNSKSTDVNEFMGQLRQTVLHRLFSVVNEFDLADNMPLATLLLAHPKIDLSLQNFMGDTVLHCVMAQNNVCVVQLLLKSPQMTEALIHTKNAAGNTPLHEGLRYGSVEACQLLLESDLFKDFTLINEAGENLLHCAAQNDKNADMILPMLLEKPHVTREQMNAEDGVGNKPLFTAFSSNCCRNAQVLLCDQRMDVMGKYLDESTALHWATAIAAAIGDLKAVRQLIKRGADINATTTDGHTPLHIAAMAFQHSPQPFWALFSHSKIDPNKKDSDGNTPWHLVLLKLYESPEHEKKSFQQCVEKYAPLVLNDPRLDISILNDEGHSLLQFAVNVGSIVNYHLLRERTQRMEDASLSSVGQTTVLEWNSPDIRRKFNVFYSFWDLLNENEKNKNLSYGDALQILKDRYFLGFPDWSEDDKQTAFRYARLLLRYDATAPIDLLALTCFVGDGLLTVKDEAQLSSDVEKVLAPKAQRFLTMAGRITQAEIGVAMKICKYAHDDPNPDEPISGKKLNASLKGLALKYSKI